LPPVEAMGLGCPVLTSDLPAVRERCGNAVVYIDPSNIEDMIDKVDEVIGNRALRAGLIASGLKQSGPFTWDGCVENTLKIIEGVAARSELSH
jgi:glycosyltransferase involved in cell wall biosynthesis